MTSRPLPSIQFRWLIILALGSRRSVDGCPQSREACIRLRLQISEHLPIASLDLGKTFIGSRKHSPDKLDDLAPQGVELGAQPLYIPLALFIPTIEIASAPPSYPTSS